MGTNFCVNFKFKQYFYKVEIQTWLERLRIIVKSRRNHTWSTVGKIWKRMCSCWLAIGNHVIFVRFSSMQTVNWGLRQPKSYTLKFNWYCPPSLFLDVRRYWRRRPIQDWRKVLWWIALGCWEGWRFLWLYRLNFPWLVTDEMIEHYWKRDTLEILLESLFIV